MTSNAGQRNKNKSTEQRTAATDHLNLMLFVVSRVGNVDTFRQHALHMDVEACLQVIKTSWAIPSMITMVNKLTM